MPLLAALVLYAAGLWRAWRQAGSGRGVRRSQAAAFFGTDAAFYFTSGYMTNHILVQALAGRAGALFVDEAGGNFALRPESPAFAIGFEAIPVDEIGLYRDELRASWPVRHEVRPGGLQEAKDKTW